MENSDFLIKILQSDYYYWIVAKNSSDKNGVNDDIMFITIPSKIERDLNYENITLKQIDDLRETECDCNIFLSGDYTPFQRLLTFYDIYDGFPIKHGIKAKDILIKSLQLNSNNLNDYKKLIND